MALAERIATLYAVFAAYQFRGLGWADPDDCNADYVDLADESAALTRPLRELTSDDLGNYYHTAVIVVGTVDDYKHFLPRIIELVVSDRRSGFHPTILRLTLNAANFRAWPSSERDAVLAALIETDRKDLVKTAKKLAEEGRASSGV